MVEKYSCSINDLETLPRMQAFSYKEISRLSQIIDIHSYENGEYVYKKGQDSDFIAVILRGKVLLCVEESPDTDKEYMVFQHRHVFGYDAFSDFPRNLTAKAVGKTTLLVISNEKRNRFDEHHPITAMKFYKLLLSYNSLMLRYITGKFAGEDV